jgi:mono/diheme cytochrome c family protein
VWAQAGGEILSPSGQVTNGILEFRRYCASCHGISGKGDGPVAQSLNPRPTNLTLLSRNNGGKFPRQHVIDVISGVSVVAAHGDRAMPVWSLEMEKAPASIVGAGGTGSPGRAKREIDLITGYIESIQEN